MEKFEGDLAGTGVKLETVLEEACSFVSKRVKNAEGKEGGCAPVLPSEPSAEKHGLQTAGGTSEEDKQEQPKAAERLGPGMREKLK